MCENGNFKQKEMFKEWPWNNKILVGNFGTIKLRYNSQELIQYLSVYGYYYIIIPWGNRKHRFESWPIYVHRAVANTHVKGYSRECCICHHIDCNPKNNSSKNLFWMTVEEHNELHREYRRY